MQKLEIVDMYHILLYIHSLIVMRACIKEWLLKAIPTHKKKEVKDRMMFYHMIIVLSWVFVPLSLTYYKYNVLLVVGCIISYVVCYVLFVMMLTISLERKKSNG
jgi:hypothetical protein